MSILEPAFPTLHAADPALRTGLTKREYAAILLRVPDSGDPDTDALIRAARRQEVATAALQGLCADPGTQEMLPNQLSQASIDIADAFIAELEKQG